MSTVPALISKNVGNTLSIYETWGNILINVKSYGAKGNGITDDTAAINKAMASSSSARVYFPDGTYMISSALSITNNVCLELSANATIKASTTMSDLINYNVSYSGFGLNRFIKGGIFDANGKANNAINIVSAVELDITDMTIKNPINRGLLVSAGYGVLASNIKFNNTIDTNIIDNIAVEMKTSDSIFEKLTMSNFTVGMKFSSGGNIISGIHPWSNQAARLPTSVGIDNRAQANEFDTIYFDTCATGFTTTHRTNLNNCIFNINRLYRSLFSSQPVYINNVNTSYVTIDQCYFEYTNQGAETYHVTVVSGNTYYVVFDNCDFATPTTLDGAPTYANQRKVKIFRFAVAFNSWPGVPVASSGGYYEKEVTITDPNCVIYYNDAVSFTPNGKWEAGIVPEYYLKNDIVGVRLYNITSTAITPANHTVWVTITKNANGSFLPYT